MSTHRSAAIGHDVFCNCVFISHRPRLSICWVIRVSLLAFKRISPRLDIFARVTLSMSSTCPRSGVPWSTLIPTFDRCANDGKRVVTNRLFARRVVKAPCLQNGVRSVRTGESSTRQCCRMLSRVPTNASGSWWTSGLRRRNGETVALACRKRKCKLSSSEAVPEDKYVAIRRACVRCACRTWRSGTVCATVRLSHK